LGVFGVIGQLQKGGLAASWIGWILVPLFLLLGLIFTCDVRKLQIHAARRTIERLDGVWPFIARKTVALTDEFQIVVEPFSNTEQYGPSVIFRVLTRHIADGMKCTTLVDSATESLAKEIANECGTRLRCHVHLAE
jgi:hypothetical protein